MDTSIRHHWSHPLIISWRLTRQENRGMQVRSRDASLTRSFLRVKGAACETTVCVCVSLCACVLLVCVCDDGTSVALCLNARV